MDKLNRTLKKIDTDKISEEVKASGPSKSKYLFDEILKVYPKQKEQTTKKLFMAVWSGTVLRCKSRDGNKFKILFEETTRIIQALYANPNSSEALFSKMRKFLIERFGENSNIYNLSTKFMGLSPEERSQRSEDYNKRVAERNEKRADLDPIHIEDVLNIVDRFKNDKDPLKRAVSVLIATGLRGIELFKISTIKKVSADEIEVLELAKSRPGKKSIRPLLKMKADEVIEGIEFIRSNLNVSGTNEEVENRLNQPLNRIFKKIVFGMTSHKARYLYANIAFKLFAESKKIPYESYVGSILGHESAQATRSYLAINLKEGESGGLQLEKPDSFDQFKNTMRRGVPESEKIANIVGALKYMKENKIYMSQKGLRLELGYSAAVMTKGYGAFKN